MYITMQQKETFYMILITAITYQNSSLQKMMSTVK